MRLWEMYNEVKYTEPKLDVEWEEANRYPHLADLGQSGWIELAKQGKCALCGAPSIQITTGARRCHGKLSAIRPVRSTKQASPLRQTAPLPWQIPAASWKGAMPLVDPPL